ncbi:MAG: bifunctional adenosylcobinamide kinase/adenosylcobinamide-phosphate guanylyltransferase [Candidatus Hodgkinia cicadicola]
MLICGCGKSGRSTYAKLVSGRTGGFMYVATLCVADRKQVLSHVRKIVSAYDVYEESIEISECLRLFSSPYATVIVDNVSVWIASLAMLGCNVYHELDVLLERLRLADTRFVLASNNSLSTGFWDSLLASYAKAVNVANRRLIISLERAYVLVAGIALRLK